MEIVQNHYVYEWVRPDYNVVFYAGKGSGNRAWDFKRNKRAKDIITYLQKNGLSPQVRILARFLTKQSAFDFEIERIAFWRDLGELANQTCGGEGMDGDLIRGDLNPMKRPEVRAKNSAAQRAKGDDQPCKRPEVRAKNSATHKAKGDAHHTKRPEVRAKMRANNSMKRPEVVAKASATQKAKGDAHHTKRPEVRAKMRAAKIKSVKELTTALEFPSAAEAAMHFGMKHQTVWLAIKFNRATRLGLKFQYIHKEPSNG